MTSPNLSGAENSHTQATQDHNNTEIPSTVFQPQNQMNQRKDTLVSQNDGNSTQRSKEKRYWPLPMAYIHMDLSGCGR